MIPSYDQLMSPLLKALVSLGGSGSINEIYEKVIELENFDEETLVLHNPEESNQTKIGYRLSWARTYLKKAGYLQNSSRGVWSLTDKAKQAQEIDSQEIVSFVRSMDNKTNEKTDSSDPALSVDEAPEEELAWREQLHQVLIEKMKPDAFERLTQRLLRESGFIQVEVTGRTGDGGIDGKGIARINGLISFRIGFQCKKYKDTTVGARDIRDFRGAIVGRADRGMFITTSRFSKDAIKEANREGDYPIDLVDGRQLADKLKELALGIKTKLIVVEKERVTVDADWFSNL